jgi:hypothetical protein
MNFSPAIANILFRAGLLLKFAAPFWVAAKLCRWKYGVDYPLDRVAKAIQWSCLGLCAAVVLFIPPSLSNVALIAAIVFTLFLIWPNLSYHLANQFRPEPPAS